MLIGLVATAPAMAEPQPAIDLRWEAPTGCPQESNVRERIQKLLGSVRPDRQLRAAGRIVRLERRFRLELEVRVRELVGTRSIESSACEDLAGAAAVEIGLLVHSVEAAAKPAPVGPPASTSSPAGGSGTSGSRSDASSSPSSSSTSSSSSSSSPSPETSDTRPAAQPEDIAKAEPDAETVRAATDPSSQAESERRWHVLLQAPLLAASAGPLPQPSAGFGLSFGFEHGPWRMQVQGISWLRQNVPATGFPGYGADVKRISAALWACRELRHSWFGFSPCLTAGLERVSASGTGQNVVPRTGQAIGVTAGAGAQARLYLTSWLRLLLAVGGAVELVRPQISIDRLGQLAPQTADPPTPVYEFAPAALTATLGLEWAL